MTNTLYVPGLGGRKIIAAQRLWVGTLNAIRPKHKKIAFFDPLWESNEAYETKFERLKNFYNSSDRPTRIWAISAGASLAVRLTVEIAPESDLHLVCGKIKGSKRIGQDYRNQAPAFVESVEKSEQLVDTINPATTHCYIPEDDADGVIETIDMSHDGAEIIPLPRLRHARAISYALARYLPRL